MIKIGIVGGHLGETTPDYPYRKWMDNVDSKYMDDGWILNEPAIVAALEHKYNDVQATFIKHFNEKSFQKNDINFLDGVNLLNAWHSGPKQYKKWYDIMKNKKNKIYPSLKEQFFLYNKGDYLKYFESKGIPIAPTFLIKKNRNADKIIQTIRQNGWKSFVIKPDYAFANIEIAKYDISSLTSTSYYSSENESYSYESFYSDTNNPKVRDLLEKYLKDNKKFPGFSCQEKMKGFVHHWEVKTFWLNGEYKYNVSMKAWPPPESFGNVDSKTLKMIKKLGKKVYDSYPETKINGKIIKPLFLRIDFGCCQGNTLDKSKYFLNEIEYSGCGKFTDLKNVFHHWPDVYYKKAKEISDK
jgi:hypothetical protein